MTNKLDIYILHVSSYAVINYYSSGTSNAGRSQVAPPGAFPMNTHISEIISLHFTINRLYYYKLDVKNVCDILPSYLTSPDVA